MRSQEAHHLRPCVPLGEGVVGGVVDHEAAAGLHVLFKRLVDLFWPGLAVVVREDDLVLGEVRAELVPRLLGGLVVGAGEDVDREPAALFEAVLDDRRGGLPIVVVLAVDDEDGDLPGVGRRGRTGHERHERRCRYGKQAYVRVSHLMFLSLTTLDCAHQPSPRLAAAAIGRDY
jgi:hypothetical protein